MSKKRPTESSSDSDEEFLLEESTTLSSVSAFETKKHGPDDEVIDEDALLGLKGDEKKTGFVLQDSTDDIILEVSGSLEFDPVDNQLDYEDTVAEEETGQVTYEEEEIFDTGEALVVDAQANETSCSIQPSKPETIEDEKANDSDSDSSNEKNDRDRFKTERQSVDLKSTTYAKSTSIPDNLELTKEMQEEIETFEKQKVHTKFQHKRSAKQQTKNRNQQQKQFRGNTPKVLLSHQQRGKFTNMQRGQGARRGMQQPVVLGRQIGQWKQMGFGQRGPNSQMNFNCPRGPQQGQNPQGQYQMLMRNSNTQMVPRAQTTFPNQMLQQNQGPRPQHMSASQQMIPQQFINQHVFNSPMFQNQPPHPAPLIHVNPKFQGALAPQNMVQSTSQQPVYGHPMTWQAPHGVPGPAMARYSGTPQPHRQPYPLTQPQSLLVSPAQQVSRLMHMNTRPGMADVQHPSGLIQPQRMQQPQARFQPLRPGEPRQNRLQIRPLLPDMHPRIQQAPAVQPKGFNPQPADLIGPKDQEKCVDPEAFMKQKEQEEKKKKRAERFSINAPVDVKPEIHKVIKINKAQKRPSQDTSKDDVSPAKAQKRSSFDISNEDVPPTKDIKPQESIYEKIAVISSIEVDMRAALEQQRKRREAIVKQKEASRLREAAKRRLLLVQTQGSSSNNVSNDAGQNESQQLGQQPVTATTQLNSPYLISLGSSDINQGQQHQKGQSFQQGHYEQQPLYQQQYGQQFQVARGQINNTRQQVNANQGQPISVLDKGQVIPSTAPAGRGLNRGRGGARSQGGRGRGNIKMPNFGQLQQVQLVENIDYEQFDKQVMNERPSNRTVIPIVESRQFVVNSQGAASQSVLDNDKGPRRIVLDAKPSAPQSSCVSIEGLSSNVDLGAVNKICAKLGEIKMFNYLPSEKRVVVKFSHPSQAVNFLSKHSRFMMDLSLITSKSVPEF